MYIILFKYCIAPVYFRSPGTRPGFLLSCTLYLLSMPYTVLLLRTPLSFHMSRIE